MSCRKILCHSLFVFSDQSFLNPSRLLLNYTWRKLIHLHRRPHCQEYSCLPYQLGFTLQGKNLLFPWGANSIPGSKSFPSELVPLLWRKANKISQRLSPFHKKVENLPITCLYIFLKVKGKSLTILSLLDQPDTSLSDWAIHNIFYIELYIVYFKIVQVTFVIYV